MNSKVGMFSVLVIGVMMLLIPATSVANAQEYEDRYYEDKQYKKVYKKSYNESYNKENERKSFYNDDIKYKKDDREKSDEPVIIIKNEPIQKKEKKKMKEPPMLLVKKDVLYCDFTVDQGNVPCLVESDLVGPNSDKYVQECNNDFVCDRVNESSFDMIVTDNIEFPGSEDGKKINFNGERYTVTEESNIGIIDSNIEIDFECQEAGFDGGFILEGDFPILLFCTVFEGDCSGIVHYDEIKECTIENYLIEALVL